MGFCGIGEDGEIKGVEWDYVRVVWGYKEVLRFSLVL